MGSATETRRSAPFLTRDEALTVSLTAQPPIQISDRRVDASELPAESPVEVVIEITTDWEMLLDSTRCSGPMNLQVVARCGPTRWSKVDTLGTASYGRLLETFSYTLVIDRSDVAGSSVACEVAVVLGDDTESRGDGAPRERSSILARHGFQIVLERGGFEFPTRWISFADHGYPKRALWRINLTDDCWFLPAGDAVQLQLNKDQEAFQRLLQNPRKDQRGAAVVFMQQIVYDALTQLFDAWLVGDVWREQVDADDTRLTDVVHRTIGRMLGENTEELRDLAEDNPAGFRMMIQNALDLGSDLD